MKKNLQKGLFLAVLCTCTINANAQLGDLLNKAKSAVSNGSTAKDVIGSLIGTANIAPKQIAAKWSYAKPALAFESDNLLSSAGGAVAATQIENKLGESLAKYGIAAGQMVMTFNSDKTYICTIKGKKFEGTYELNKANIIFHPKIKSSVSISANAKITGNNLQITFRADKLLTFVQSINTTGVPSTTLNTVSSLIKNFNGMQVGFTFTKK